MKERRDRIGSNLGLRTRDMIEIIRTSPPHGHEYIYNPEDYRLVYMNFARL